MRIEWMRNRVTVAAVGLFCLCAPRIVAQRGEKAAESVPAASADPILTAQLDLADSPDAVRGVDAKAARMYRRAIHELYQGHAEDAEQDALRAAERDRKFADAEALAATAALVEKQFSRAETEATEAARRSPEDEKAWVILATAENYLSRYAEAADALGHIQARNGGSWQAAYQRARAEAGQDHAAETLEWANRAALGAPHAFAPLHLLRASALLTAGQYSAAADELETYLQLSGPGEERGRLNDELSRLRVLARKSAAPGWPSGNAERYTGQAD